jgi:hypothetical protein
VGVGYRADTWQMHVATKLSGSDESNAQRNADGPFDR